MIFACVRCGRRYSVPDERVQGRQFRVTCRACATVLAIRPGVDGAPATVTSVPAAASAAPEPALAPDAARAPAAPAPAAAPFEQPVAPPAPRPPAPARPPPLQPPAAPAPASPSAPGPMPDLFSARTIPPAPPSGVRPHLSDAELEWLSTPGPGGEVDDPAPPQGEEDDPSAEPPDDAREAGLHRGPRFALAGVLLGVAVAAAAFAAWQLRGKPTAVAQRPAPVAVRPPSPPPPPPAAEPAPAADQAPASAVAPAEAQPAPSVPGPAVPEPAEPDAARPRGSRRAQFEPEAIAVRRIRPKRHLIARKDREMLDLLERKQDASAPTPAEPLAVGTGAGLDPATVTRTLDAHQGAFSSCLSRALKGGGATPSRATLLVSVDPGGTVAAAWIAEVEVDRTPLGRCLTSAARRVRFPSFDGDPMEVSVPMVLEAR